MFSTLRTLLLISAIVCMSPASRAADPAAIKRAIAQGEAYLRNLQRPNGSWPFVGHAPGQPAHAEVGATALAAVTLLECGAGRDDPAIQRAATFVRAAVSNLTFTYSISTCIIFFDRLGDLEDTKRIELLTLRLLGGQRPQDGNWGYECPLIRENEVEQIRNALARPGATPAREGSGEGDPGAQPRAGVGTAPANHSTTQFAVFALWIGRKQGIPVRAALGAVETHFRLTQSEDGTWDYPIIMTRGVNPSMTCAGLIGLAIAYGYANDAVLNSQLPFNERRAKRKPVGFEGNRDFNVRLGLLALGNMMDLAMLPPRKAIKSTGQPESERPVIYPRNPNKSQNYFLWSLERVAVAYGLETIGNKDWYGKGADLLLATQEPNGSWHNDFNGDAAETAFGLLFLKRADLAPDLSATLRGKIRDPGRILRAGGSLPKGQGRQTATKSEPPAPTRGDRPKLSFGDDEATAQRSTEFTSEAARLSSQLVEAPPDTQLAKLEKLRDAKGVANTGALALAIPQLNGRVKNVARDALAQRLSTMTAETLKDKFSDADAEIRRAAAVASAMKEEKELIPDLIDLLSDPQTSVARAAEAALKALTKKDFGLKPEMWREWWNQR
jgi:hypothetical protein